MSNMKEQNTQVREAIRSILLFLTAFIVLFGCQPQAIFTAAQEKEIEKRFATVGITAQYDSPLSYTTGEQGLAFVVSSPLSAASEPVIKKTVESFLTENRLSQYCFVGIFVKGNANALIVDLDVGPPHQKPIWKGKGELLMPANHKVPH